jgi:hypothetical protein
MLGGLRKSEKRLNGANGHSPVGGGTNGDSSPAPHTAIEVAGDFGWTLEVREDQQLLGSMHSSNPFVLINFFRQYSVLFGPPVGNHAVWLRHRQSDRGAPLHPLSGETAWLDFLRRLDPNLDDHLADMQACVERTSMIDRGGRPTYPDAILEVAFGQN